MSNEHFDSIKRGLEDAVAYMQGDHSRGTAHTLPILDIKALRKTLDMTQTEFASLIGSTQQTVASWEQEKSPRHPVGPTQRLLFLLQKNPKIVEDLRGFSK